MALNAYFEEVTGEKQGKFKGGVIQKGREGWIEIINAAHEIVSPRDPASGQATGKRSHKPIVTTQAYDQSMPAWYQALVFNESLKSVTIDFFSANKLGTAGGQGVETLTYQVKLTNAFVSNIRFRMPDNRTPETVNRENEFSIELVYQKIEGTWKLGNKVWQDDWLAPV